MLSYLAMDGFLTPPPLAAADPRVDVCEGTLKRRLRHETGVESRKVFLKVRSSISASRSWDTSIPVSRDRVSRKSPKKFIATKRSRLKRFYRKE